MLATIKDTTMRATSPRPSRAARRVGLFLLGGWLFGGLLPVGVAHAQLAAPPQASAAAPLIFQGVTVIDVRDGRHLPKQTVVIVGNRIQTIAPTGRVRVPTGARVVNARGKYLIPGLWDMHVHIREFIELAAPLLLANGVTGVREAGSEVPLATLSQWKREIAAGTRVGPRLLVSGPALTDAPPSDRIITQDTSIGWRMYVSVPLALARYAVDSLKAAGADLLKIYDPSLVGRVTMAAEARRLGIPFGGHSANMPGLAFSDSGATFLDHNTWTGVCGDGEAEAPDFDAQQCAAVAQHLRRNNTWVTLLSGGMNHLYQGRAVALTRRYMPASFGSPATDSAAAVPDPTSTADWRQALARARGRGDKFEYGDHIATLQAAGVPFLVGTDMNLIGGFFLSVIPGFSVHETLLSFVLAGMTPPKALQAGTLDPAQALRATDSLGTVAAGKVADLVLLDADPLADIWNTTKIRAVVANGRYYDRATLDQLLVQAEQMAARR